jgi:hypothetical protein
MRLVKNLRKNPIVLFAFAFLLALSGLFSPTALAAPKMSQSWKLEFTGEPLFNAIVQKDGSLLYGNYNIVNRVYHADIMTIDAKGKKTKAWSVKEEQVDIGGTTSNPQILAINYSKGTITSYTPAGKRMWTYSLKQKMSKTDDGYMTDENGNLRLFIKDKIYTIAPNGKLLFTMPYPAQGDIEFSPDGSMYVLDINYKDWKKSSLMKYTNDGKLAWKRNLSINNPKIIEISGGRIVKIGNRVYVNIEYSGEDVSTRKLYAIDKNGNINWGLDVIGNTWELTEYKNNILLMTDSHFYQLEPNGKIRTKLEVSADETDYIQNILFTSKGELLVNTGKLLTKITPNGAYSWKTSIPSSEAYGLHYVDGMILLIDYDKRRFYSYSDSGKSLSTYPFTGEGYIILSGVNLKLKTLYVTQSTYIEKSKKYRTILHALKY